MIMLQQSVQVASVRRGRERCCGCSNRENATRPSARDRVALFATDAPPTQHVHSLSATTIYPTLIPMLWRPLFNRYHDCFFESCHTRNRIQFMGIPVQMSKRRVCPCRPISNDRRDQGMRMPRRRNRFTPHPSFMRAPHIALKVYSFRYLKRSRSLTGSLSVRQ